MTPDGSSHDAATLRIVERFEALPALAAADADLLRRGRFLTCDFEIGVGPIPLLVRMVEGKVASIARGPFLLKPWVFAIRAPAEVWEKFLEPMPAAGWHDLMALTKVGRARVEGNLVPFMGNLQVIKDLLALPRAQQVGRTGR
ncbi:MAG: hypothetical protein R3D67_13170 [Hyphomicrobiaceae bacterium]